MNAARYLTYSCDDELSGCGVFIITANSIDTANRPDLSPLESASEMVGRHLTEGDVVIYESTVFPGATEEVCVPILERVSGLKFNQEFLWLQPRADQPGR